jgi:3-oxoisoapionate kinase
VSGTNDPRVGRASRLPRPRLGAGKSKEYLSPTSSAGAGETPALRLTFYGDDFTGSTDALEQLTLAGVRTVLFIAPPTRRQLARFKNVQAIGVAGRTRSLTPGAMERELRPALKQLKALGAPHVHYKVCSTFDSSPKIGSIGRVIDVATKIFRAPFVPLLVAAPPLGRYCVFGNLFARFGIGSSGAIYRLDRHPSVSRHPITPMQEADLRLHLAKQTKQKIGLFDILIVARSPAEMRSALKKILAEDARIVLFDAIYNEQLKRVGELIDACASRKRPLFSVGSSGVEMALGAHWKKGRQGSRSIRMRSAAAAKPLLVVSGSCSAVTAGQISWALKRGFAEVVLRPNATVESSVHRAAMTTIKHLKAGRSVIVHTGKRTALKDNRTGRIGAMLGRVLRLAVEQTHCRRFCIAGGDTSSYVARALGIEAVEMIARLTPGAPLCRAHAPGSPIDGLEVVFKGGQVGAENYFATVREP